MLLAFQYVRCSADCSLLCSALLCLSPSPAEHRQTTLSTISAAIPRQVQAPVAAVPRSSVQLVAPFTLRRCFMRKRICSVLFLCLFLNSANAQTPVPVRDPNAVAVASKALQALAGTSVITDVTVQASAT